MCRPLLQYCLDFGYIQREHIKTSFWPTRNLPADTFREPLARFDEATQKLVDAAPFAEVETRRFAKGLVQKAIGFTISCDEPMRFVHTCSCDPGDRPPNSTLLPSMRDDFWEWVQHTERRSTESLRPVHSLVMQISRLRMHLLARQISQIPGWRPQWLCQAKTDCWRVACPKNKLAAVKQLNKLTYRDFGADSDNRAVRVMERPDRMQECADIRMNGVSPEIVKHRRHESWEKLLGRSFGIFGCGGGGKSTAMREIATRLKERGKRVHILSFQNSVCAKNGKDGCTIHTWIRRMNAGEIELPCTCLVDEAPYCNIFVLSRLCPFMLLPEIQWIWVGDFAQPQAHGHWRC